MKVRCTCNYIFDYEENNRVCPNCKKFHPLPKEDNKKKDKNKKIEPKKKVEDKNPKEMKNNATNIINFEAPKDNSKIENIDNFKNINKAKNLKSTNKEKSNSKNIDKNSFNNKELIENKPKELFNRKESEIQKRHIVLIVGLFILIMIIPILNAILTDKTETIKGGDGTLISSRTQEFYLDEASNEVFAIRGAGYTRKGKLYISYESNVYGFADNGYDISFYVEDEFGNSTQLGFYSSDFTVLKDELSESYYTKAITDYKQSDTRLISLRIIIDNQYTGAQRVYTYSF